VTAAASLVSLTSPHQPTAVPKAPQVLAALRQRLAAAAEVLLAEPLSDLDGDPGRDAARLLAALVTEVRTQERSSGLWLLYVAVIGCFPSMDEMAEIRRQFELDTAIESTLWLLDVALDKRDATDLGSYPMRIVRDGVLADVDHTARNDLHTGIQQVVRRTLPIWVRDHDVIPVAWTDGRNALRGLNRAERQRVLAWSSAQEARSQPPDETQPALVVPWNCTVALFEVPLPGPASALAALAQYSGNELVAIGYDCIPVISAASVPFDDRFPEYLSIIKYAHRVAGISVSATVEFQGFANMLPTQGLPGPRVIECQLAAESPIPVSGARAAPRPRPLVLSVGSFEPRKNGLALLQSAETLWREGLEFDLLFIGGSTWGDEFPARLERLQAQGRPVSARRGVDDVEVMTAFRAARFTVFASLHEGYGLPVAESLGAGTPVITANYGSTQEIAAAGGAITIDPRDDEALISAMRRLLTDDALLAQLQAQLPNRPTRSWDQYAAELWTALVEQRVTIG
jgi:glycosyltransferase involved in cell wall biosynthesis